MEKIRWDYRMVGVLPIDIPGCEDGFNRLKELGKEGWEVVGAVAPVMNNGGTYYMDSSGGGKSKTGVLLKRPMIPEWGY